MTVLDNNNHTGATVNLLDEKKSVREIDDEEESESDDFENEKKVRDYIFEILSQG